MAHQVYPDAIAADNASFSANGAATKYECVDDLRGAPNDDNDYVGVAGITGRLRFSGTAYPEVLKINGVTLRARMRRVSGGNGDVKIYIRPTVGGATTDYDSDFFAVTAGFAEYTDVSWSWPTNPNTGEDWTVEDLNVLEFGYLQQSIDVTMRHTSIYVDVDDVSLPDNLGAVRFLGSAELNMMRRPHAIVEVPAPERYSDIPILGEVDLTHLAMPTTETERGRETWQRARAIKLGERFNPNNAAAPLFLRLLLMRHYKVAWWDTMETEQAPSAFADGVARLSSGAGRTFERASSVYVLNPAAGAQGSQQLVEIFEDQEALTVGGTLLQNAGRNECIQSSFRNISGSDFSGWTKAGTGSNGSAIDFGTELLFDERITERSARFLAGTPIHASDLQLTGTASAAIADGTTCCVWFWHLDVSASAPLYYQAIRDVGGVLSYWRDSDSTWQAGATWNAMTGSTIWHLHATKPMAIGTNTPDATLQARVGIPTASGVAGQINYLAHAQIEKNAYPTSAMVTDGTAASGDRVADDLRLTNDHGKRIFTFERDEPLTLFFEFKPQWNSSDLITNALREFWTPFIDSSNLARVFYQQSSLQLIFRLRIAGVNYSATIAATITRDEWQKVAVRMVSTHEEYGNAAHAISIFHDGVKGTDATAVGYGSAPSESTVYFGQNDTPANRCDAVVRRVRVVFEALSDDEIIGEMEA